MMGDRGLVVWWRVRCLSGHRIRVTGVLGIIYLPAAFRCLSMQHQVSCVQLAANGERRYLKIVPFALGVLRLLLPLPGGRKTRKFLAPTAAIQVTTRAVWVDGIFIPPPHCSRARDHPPRT
jgi:hypothetical protein